MDAIAELQREALDFNFNTMVSAFAFPVAVVIVYRSIKISLIEQSIIFKLNFVQAALLLINTVVQLISVFHPPPSCRFPYFLYTVLSYLGLLCVDTILYLKAYYANKSSKFIAVVCVLLQVVRLYFVIQSNISVEFEVGQINLCREVETNKWVLGIIGSEAMVIIFLCSLYLMRVYKQSQLTPSAVLSTVIRQGFTYPLAICVSFIILASLLLANVASGNTRQFLNICWVLNAWLATKQVAFAHEVRQKDRAAAMNLVNQKIALTQSLNHPDAVLTDDAQSNPWDLYLGIPKARTPSI
ncbi:hypothetical protein K493DRAFT_81330 [Basidiobolus meristosporus CBS 931.73]|uniref:G-protein coupled receptors family 1 profile domain-containing protein n=1 Tax=Basidiobolus meristosporus CBS 931.73 TaxID=1314790 RepID=A0A1Y1XNP6_9FUNG|nr:hypothetical protein K493DRAFT_81330 [Basidiobolus meristosporus CBS 931.73]|eukprot:ORX87351.1 hypothetical protein K493DRAFT_81330 [Basidiobolus meristosporus CBS 931.73]